MTKRALVVAGVFGAAVAGVVVCRQQSSNACSSTPPAIRVTTRLVMVDVVASSKDGKPITDLKAEDFAPWTSRRNGQRAINLDFYATAFSSEGRMVANTGDGFDYYSRAMRTSDAAAVNDAAGALAAAWRI